MTHKTLIIVAVGMAAGYFLATKLGAYQPFSFAYQQGAKFGLPPA